MSALFVQLEARLDKITPTKHCLCGLPLRAAVMGGAIFMALAGCVMLVHSPVVVVGTFRSLAAGQSSGTMQRWAFVYVHLYLIALHVLLSAFLLYAVPLAVLALRSAYQYEATYLRSYFRMNVQAVGLLVLGSLFNLMLDNTLCGMQRADPFGDGYITGSTSAGSLSTRTSDHCDFGANLTRLVCSVLTACVYCYLAWVTYCFRRELEQGEQLDDDVVAMAEQAAAEMHKQREGRANAHGAGARGVSDDEIEMRAEGGGIPVRARIGDRYAL